MIFELCIYMFEGKGQVLLKERKYWRKIKSIVADRVKFFPSENISSLYLRRKRRRGAINKRGGVKRVRIKSDHFVNTPLTVLSDQ